VVSQVAFVGCGQGIALVPHSLKRFCSKRVVLRQLKEKVSIVTTAVAWNASRGNPLVQAMVALLRDAKVTVNP